MSKKYLALVLAFLMVLSLFAGCGKTENAVPASQTEEPAAETAEEAVEEGPVEEPAAEEPTAEEPDEPAEAEDAEEPAEEEPQSAGLQEDGSFLSPGGVQYPLEGDDNEVSYWTSFATQAQLAETFTSYNQLPLLPLIKERTGVQVRFEEVSGSAETQMFQLMIASGDYTDVLALGSLYSGGMSQAYADDVIIDLTDDLPEYAPDYWAMLEQESDASLSTVLVDGKYLSINNITYDGLKSTGRGNVIRYDILQELGYDYDDMLTVEGATQVMRDVHTATDMYYTCYVLPTGAFCLGTSMFDVPQISLKDVSSLSLYMEDDTVCSAYMADNYRDYVSWFADLYQEGVINENFYTGIIRPEEYAQQGIGEMFFWESGADTIDNPMDYMDEFNQDADIEPVAPFVPYEGYVDTWGSPEVRLGAGYSITSNCEDPSLVMAFSNYFFTDVGYILINYGEEGVSYTLDEDGNPHYTDLVANNPSGLSPDGARAYYTCNDIPYWTSALKMFETYSDKIKSCFEIWSPEKQDENRNYPQAIQLTDSQSDTINSSMNDCISYGQEMILKFMTGALDVNDDAQWEGYLEGMNSFGIQNCLDVYQEAYDSYRASH